MKQLVTACICCLLSFATFSGSAQTNPITLRLNHIAVYVHDLGQSTAFYEDVLQLKQIPEPFKDGRHTWFSLGDAGQLHLIQGASQNIPRDKNDHLCFSVASIEDFIANLDKHQVEYTNWPGTAKTPTVRVDGVKQIYFQDPDGHWIEVNNDRLGR
ncbi:VOC family protein [Pontibacter anaerobius]|uniref:VOC family protein n=1 Tax=Pontibacter anaerobius TaxID=2993940 RepID=A0ABT3RHG0_9BACT|nr:VOC family protein [Pontibacter anaerobius]MCX2741272.1 VOC family protein [Pontibacter anaerobius]